MKTGMIIRLIVSIGLPLLAGGVAGIFTSRAIPDWYSNLNAPSFSPPDWLFGPVWTTLYVLMGVSLFLVWKLPPDPGRNLAIIVFFVQLFLNFAWSFLFFYFKSIGGALLEIFILWISIVVMMVLFYRLRPLAAWINVPYLLWVTFATALTAAYYRLN